MQAGLKHLTFQAYKVAKEGLIIHIRINSGLESTCRRSSI
jgi:hypothetical protein